MMCDRLHSRICSSIYMKHFRKNVKSQEKYPEITPMCPIASYAQSKRFQIYQRYFDTSAPIENVSSESCIYCTEHGNKKLVGTINFLFTHINSK